MSGPRARALHARCVEVRIGKKTGRRASPPPRVLAQLKASGETVTAIDLRFRDQVVLRTPVKEGANAQSQGAQVMPGWTWGRRSRVA